MKELSITISLYYLLAFLNQFNLSQNCQEFRKNKFNLLEYFHISIPNQIPILYLQKY